MTTRWAALAAEYPEAFHWIEGRPYPIICGGTGGGSTKTTVTNVVPPKTKEELALIGKQNEILDIQITELKRQNDVLAAIFPEQKKLLAAQTEAAIAGAAAQKLQISQISELAAEQMPLLKEQTALAREQLAITRKAGALQESLVEQALRELEGTPEEREIRTLSNQRALAVLKGEAPPLSAGQQERINTVFGRAAEEAQGSLRTFGEELAASRGLRLTDTPIGGEVLRQGRELAASLAASKAGAELNVGQTEQVFAENVRQFQEQLRQQAFQNRMALTGRPASGGGLPIALTLAGGGSGAGMMPTFAGTTTGGALSGAQNMLNTLSADRLGSGTQNTRGPGADLTGTYISAGAGLAGAALSSYALYAGLSAGAAASSARYKKAIRPYDQDEYDRALAKVNATPITRWKYKHEPDSQRPHTGPIVELSPDDIKFGETHIDLLSYSGLLHAALKAVDRKVGRLERQLPREAVAAAA